MKEIDRILFVSLCYDAREHMYYVLNDQNFVEKFWAENENVARQIFHTKYGK